MLLFSQPRSRVCQWTRFNQTGQVNWMLSPGWWGWICFPDRAFATRIFKSASAKSALQTRGPRLSPNHGRQSNQYKGKWCPEEDSNLHALQRCYLKAVRLPIPPSGQSAARVTDGLGCVNQLISSSRFLLIFPASAANDCSKVPGSDKGSAMRLIIMGVSGAGKSTLGTALAKALGWRFLDADDFHSEAAKAKIASGQTLDEVDRAAWLDRIVPRLDASDTPTILACSALKAIHRDSLKPDVLVHIVIPPELAITRLEQRRDHFAGPSIAPSQFAALEVPDDAISVQADWTTEAQVAFILSKLTL
jgi:gluconokinase